MQIQATKDRLPGFVDAGQLGIFANGYWGHPAMHLPPDVNLLAVHHYLQALEYQRKANQVVAILGSKTPNIQNLAVGGVANAINLDNQATLNMDKLLMVKSLLDEVVAFVQQVYVPDVCAIGAMYPEWLGYGAGVTNYLAVPDLPIDTKGTQFDLPGGTIMGGDFGTFKPIKSFDDPYFKDNVEESIAHSWYDGSWQRHPFEGTTVPKHTKFDEDGKYSWVKAPRFQGKPMQVGPLAQVLVGYVGGHEPTKRWADLALKTVSSHREGPGHAGHAALDARPPRGAGDPHRGHRRDGAEALEAARRQHREAATSRSSTRPRSRAARSAGSASTRRRAGRSRTGRSSRAARSRTTRRWSRPPGTRAPGTARTRRARTRRLSSGTRSRTRSGPSRC